MKKGFILLTVLALTAMLFVGCDSYEFLTQDQSNLGTSSESTISEPSTGTVEVRVTDGPPGYEVQEVVMQIVSAEIHMAEEEQYQNEGQDNQHQNQEGDVNWIPLGMLVDTSFELTELQNGKEQTLALGHVDPGKYTQIRLGIAKDSVKITYTKGDEPPDTVTATLPSDTLKFVRPFNVEAEETTVITFDFIVDESVVFTGAKAGEAPKVIFKPVIKLSIQEGGEPEVTSLEEGEPEITPLDLTPEGGNAASGEAFDVTVTLYDEYGDVDTDYTGTVQFLSDDSSATLPVDYTFTVGDAGQHTFSVTLMSLGDQTITVTDTVDLALTDTETWVVAPYLDLTPDGGSAVSGVGFDVTVTIYNEDGNVDTDYTGTVQFLSEDSSAILPGDYTFDGSEYGTKTFTVILVSRGDQTITVYDTVEAALTDTETYLVGS